MRRPAVSALLLLSSAGITAASDLLTGEATLYEDQYFDMDEGVSLGAATAGGARADFVFDRVRGELSLLPQSGARLAAAPWSEFFEWQDVVDLKTPAPDAIPLADEMTLTGVTSEGRAFRACVQLSWKSLLRPTWGASGSDHPFIAFDFVVQRDGTPLLPAPVGPLKSRFEGNTLLVTWRDDGGSSWRVRWSPSDAPGSLTRIDVDEPEIRIEPNVSGAALRVRVTRRLEGGGESAPRDIACPVAPRGIRRTFLDLPDTHAHEYRINLRDGCDDPEDPDWIPYFWGMKTPQGGGIRWLGEGRAAFDAAHLLPESGYARRWEQFRANYVYAIRLRDGRFVKVWVLPQTDVRDGLKAEIVFLEGGGRTIPPGPRNLKATFDGRSVRLTWIPVPGVRDYAVLQRDGAASKELARVQGAEALLENVETSAILTLAVAGAADGGLATDLSEVCVPTFSEGFRYGTCELDAFGSDGFDFSTHESVAPATAGDLWITSSAGGASSLTFRGPSGIESGIADAFGKFDKAETLPTGRDIRSDDRRPDTMSFRVASSEGGFAHVRIRDAHGMRVTLEYVYLPPEEKRGPAKRLAEVVEALAGRARRLTEPERAAVLREVGRLADDAPATRQSAEDALAESGPEAAELLYEQWKATSDEEVRARIESAIRRIAKR
jgi:hypothetical protein